MLAKISSSIVDWQIRKGYLEDRDRAVYQYGYELLINQSINILVAVFISILFHSFDIVFIFLLSYIPLNLLFRSFRFYKATMILRLYVFMINGITRIFGG